MNYIIEKDQYLTVLATWKQTKDHKAVDHIIYNVLRGFDPKRGFTPITKAIKLENGAQEWEGYQNALSSARSKIKGPSTYTSKYDTVTSIARRQQEDADRLKSLQTNFGIEFTPELLSKLQEALK